MKFKGINPQTAYAGESESQEDMELDENDANSDEDSDSMSIFRGKTCKSGIKSWKTE